MNDRSNGGVHKFLSRPRRNAPPGQLMNARNGQEQTKAAELAITSAQHARIRRHIRLIPVYMWLAFAWTVTLTRLPLGLAASQPPLLDRDFATFYTQGTVAIEHNAHALYDRDEQAAILRRVATGAGDRPYPTVHGPQIAVLFAPFALLSYEVALDVWVAITLIGYFACAYVVWRACPRLHDRAWTGAILLVAAPALQYDVIFGQTAVIGLALFTAAFFALRANRSVLAGLLIGSLIYKPQFGLVAAVVFVGTRQWNIVAGAIIGAAAQLAIGAAYWGPSILLDYGAALLRLPDVAPDMESRIFEMHSWRAFFQMLPMPAPIAFGAYVVAAIVTIAVALVCWRAPGSLAIRYSVLLMATVLTSPHLYVYDLIVLMPAFLLLWDWSLANRTITLGELVPAAPFAALRGSDVGRVIPALLFAGCFSPLFGTVRQWRHVQPSIVILAVLAGLFARALMSTETAQLVDAAPANVPAPHP